MSGPPAIDAQLNRLQRTSAIVGGTAAAACVIAAFLNRSEFWPSYLIAFLFWSGVPLGCLALLMLHHLVGGGWGFLIRRLLEAGTRTLPLVALLVVPLLLGTRELYVWSHPAAVALDPLLQHKRAYLNLPFFIVRAAAYFAIWTALAHTLNRWTGEQDRTGAASLSKRLYALSGPGLVVYGLTVTFASLDWVMSLEPDWFSTIFSAVFMMGQVLSAFGVVIVVLTLVIGTEPLSSVAFPQYLDDLGNLVLAFVMLWAYMAFSQFLIIWSGNLTDEISWYLHRLRNGWEWVAALLVACHFALPFLLLLSREIKRNVRYLARLAAALLVMRLIDIWWNVEPAFSPTAVRIHWTDAVATLAIGGLWVAAFLFQIRQRPLLPVHDPELPTVLTPAPQEAS